MFQTMTLEVFQKSVAAGSFPALRDVAYRYFESLSVRLLSYHHYPPIGALDYKPYITVAALGFPAGWVKTYVEQRYYDNDPIIRYAASCTRPFWWHDIQDLCKLEVKEERFLEHLADTNLGFGLAVPVFGPHGRNGYFGIGFGGIQPELSAQDLNRIHWGCQLIHLRYCELLQEISPVEIKLSHQEKSVLRLISKGYSNSQISAEMNVTPRTVATYVARSFDKLDVHDRMTAALRALAMGLLD